MVPTHQHRKAGLMAHVPPKGAGHTPGVSSQQPPLPNSSRPAHKPRAPPPLWPLCRHQEGRQLPPKGGKLSLPSQDCCSAIPGGAGGAAGIGCLKSEWEQQGPRTPREAPQVHCRAQLTPALSAGPLLGPRLGPCTWPSNTDPRAPTATTAGAVTQSLEEQKGHPADPGEGGVGTAGSFHHAWGGGHPAQSKAAFLRWPGPF